MYKHILICTDGSPLANKAGKAGVALAKALGARVTAYSAIDDLLPLYAEGYAFSQETVNDLEKAAHAVGQKRVDKITAMAKSAKVPYAGLVTMAAKADEGIIKAAKKGKCDAIFLASHGRRGFSKLIMGSVTQSVLAHTKIPVVVYR